MKISQSEVPLTA